MILYIYAHLYISIHSFNGEFTNSFSGYIFLLTFNLATSLIITHQSVFCWIGPLNYWIVFMTGDVLNISYKEDN